MDKWAQLKTYTRARIGMKSSQHAISTRDHLHFQLDHAKARDAVHLPWFVDELQKTLELANIPFQSLQSAVNHRHEYLKRPDLGMRLHELSQQQFAHSEFDISIVMSNGLSSSALNHHGGAFVTKLWHALFEQNFKLSPVYLIENARVAISDEVGFLARSKLVLILLGERPGLSACDSLALYLTYAPKPGNVNAQRNCISNIRPPHGLSYEHAVQKTLYLLKESLRRQLSGVHLKEDQGIFVNAKSTIQCT